MSATLTDDGSLTNSGDLSAANVGVVLGAAAALSNQSTGTITGKSALSASAGPVSIVNAGKLGGAPGAGITLSAGGVITNQFGGVITGHGGIMVSGAAGTVTNAGSIIGTGGDAVRLAAGFNNRVVITPGATFSGVVDGGNNLGSDIASTLELTSAATTGTLGGPAGHYIDFASITLDDGASWSVSSTVTVAKGETITFSGTSGLLALGAPASVAGAISGFRSNDEIDLAGVVPGSVQYAATGGGQLDFSFLAGGTGTIALPGAGPVRAVTDDLGGALVSIACFHAGTGIATDLGQTAVEHLRIGDLVRTHRGELRPIRWIGHRRIDLTRHPTPDDASPIRFRAGALADGVPSRDLRVSPDHAMSIGGGLVPARLLVNGASITQEIGCRVVDWYHVELETHDVLLAENAPAESYLDTGNRGMFENAGEPLLLHPRFADGQAGRVGRSCAPFLDDPSVVEPLWRHLAARSGALGFALPEAAATTADPGLTLWAAGRVFRPLFDRNGLFRFALPKGEGPVRLISRATAPASLRPWAEDRRLLGVAVRRVTLRHGDEIETFAADHPALTDGWWPPERDSATLWRWTNGDALLPVRLTAASVIEIETSGDGIYCMDDRHAVRQQRARMGLAAPHRANGVVM